MDYPQTTLHGGRVISRHCLVIWRRNNELDNYVIADIMSMENSNLEDLARDTEEHDELIAKSGAHNYCQVSTIDKPIFSTDERVHSVFPTSQEDIEEIISHNRKYKEVRKK